MGRPEERVERSLLRCCFALFRHVIGGGVEQARLYDGVMMDTVEDAELRGVMWSRIEPLALHKRDLQTVSLRRADPQNA